MPIWGAIMEDIEFMEKLKNYPEILQKFKELLVTIERRDFESVDSIEEALIPDVRGLGKMLLSSWASEEEKVLKNQTRQNSQKQHSKKNYIGIQHLET